MVTTHVGEDDDAAAVAIQPDGKIVVAGTSDDTFALARYLPDGTADTSFGGGKVTTHIPDSNRAMATSVAIQPDGKIVVAGYSEHENEPLIPVPDGFTLPPSEWFTLARYLPDGALDPDFGQGGTVVDKTIPVAPGGWGGVAAGSRAYGLSLQDAGIVVVGTSCDTHASFGHRTHLATVRYDQSGAQASDLVLPTNSTFAGKNSTDCYAEGTEVETLSAVDLLQTGRGEKIVVAGRMRADDGLPSLVTMRLLPDGLALDGASRRVDRIDDLPSVATGVAAQGDSVVVAGYSQAPGEDADIALVRYDSGGNLDPGFGGLTDVNGSQGDDRASAVAVHEDKILVAGTSQGRPFLARYDTDGKLDPTFGTNGFAGLASAGTGAAMAVQPDCNVVVAGSTNGDFALARYLGPGPHGVAAEGGPSSGGSRAVFEGGCFEPGAAVRLGGVEGTDVSVNPERTRLEVTTPARDAEDDPGPVRVEFTNPTGRIGESSFTYHPTVSAIIPPSGGPEGGTTVTVNGLGLAQAAELRFGDHRIASDSFVAHAADKITLKTPPNPPGAVRVTLSVADLASMTPVGAPNANVFTYTDHVPENRNDLTDPAVGPPPNQSNVADPALPSNIGPAPGGSPSPSPAADGSAGAASTPGAGAQPGAAQAPGAAATGQGAGASAPVAAVAPPPANPAPGASAMGGPPPPPPGSNLLPTAAPDDVRAGERVAPAAGTGDRSLGDSRYAMARSRRDGPPAALGLGAGGAALLFGYLTFFTGGRSGDARRRPAWACGGQGLGVRVRRGGQR